MNFYISNTFFYVIYITSDTIITYITIVCKGISSHLMKLTSKRRRTKQEIKEEKTREELKQREIAEKMAAFEELQAKFR